VELATLLIALPNFFENTAVFIIISMRRHILSRANVVASERQLDLSQSPFALRFYSHSA
jgi:hypothetical protein